MSRERLGRPPFGGVHWNSQRSGISIQDEVGAELEAAFLTQVGERSSRLPEESQVNRLPTAARRQVVVNAYERSPRARRECLDYYGYRCTVCNLRLDEKYGSAADELIHVHHLTPVALVGTTEWIDPIRDLRPVCPNCHAVIHRHDPPCSIAEVSSMIDQDA